MNAQAWIALAVLGLTVGGLLVNAGIAFQKLNQHGEDIKTLKAETKAHAGNLSGLLAVLGPLKDKLDEMSQDVKSLLSGRRGRGTTD